MAETLTPKTPLHFIGIGGIGMSAVARLGLRDHPVTGSDMKRSALTEALEQEGATIFIGQKESQVQPEMTVVLSTDIAQNNPERQEAERLGCQTMHRSQLLAHFLHQKRALAVAGTHGKTTTSSLVAWLLFHAHGSASYALGGILKNRSKNAEWGESPFFVAEADESDGTFLNYYPEGAIITNIDNDHMNFYQNEERLVEYFQLFANQVKNPQLLFSCIDDPGVQKAKLPGRTYGFSPQAEIQITRAAPAQAGQTLTVKSSGWEIKDLFIPLLGKHNLLNATAAVALARALDISEASIREALSTFQGVARRADFKGTLGALELFDDYAHHPTEVKTTIEGFKSSFQERPLLVIFQPHRYSRLQSCFHDFVASFDAADQIWLTDVYSAGEAPIGNMTSDTLMQALEKRLGPRINKISREAIAEELIRKSDQKMTALFLGAGDLTHCPAEALARYKAAQNPSQR